MRGGYNLCGSLVVRSAQTGRAPALHITLLQLLKPVDGDGKAHTRWAFILVTRRKLVNCVNVLMLR
jgi:hypothetical protein